jgi:Ni/Co efflux regulator RcnB
VRHAFAASASAASQVASAAPARSISARTASSSRHARGLITPWRWGRQTPSDRREQRDLTTVCEKEYRFEAALEI